MNKTFCIYPWINFHTTTEGRCKLCCHVYTEDYIKVGDNDAIVGHHDIDQIWFGDYMENVRNKMLNGEPVKECSRCYEHELKGIESSREWANKNYFTKQYLSLEYPKHLELRLGNKCNLKCNSCWSVSSSNLYKERKKIMSIDKDIPEWINNQWHHEINIVESFDFKWFETKEFSTFIDKVSPTLEKLYLTGGEPTLIKANVNVLNSLIKYNNNSCYVAWTTNLTSWPQEFYESLDFFDSSEVQMSIDGYKSSNTYIRYPTEWDIVEKNFKNALDLPSKVSLKVYFVVQAWNLLDIRKLVTWLETFERKIDFVPIFLEYPDQLHSTVWPKEVIEFIINDLQKIYTKRHSNSIERIINYLHDSIYDKKKITKMKEFIAINDKYRKIKFKDIFPYFHQIIEKECKI